ncbi:MAG TPA: MMPL family transporter, partial [Kofleriaceae bacterium]
EIGVAGGVPTAVAEHDAVADGILISSLLTAALVGGVLLIHLRGVRLLVIVTVQIVAATIVSFGIAAIAVGHLNSATAFLGAIIAGNGVNYGILLIARYIEERKHHEVDDALAIAIRGTLRPTAVASLGASIAYGSLAATSFKGFADFAVIGAVGMILCWIASYLLLPALVLRWGRHTRRVTGDPVVGSVLVRVLGFRRAKPVIVVASVMAIGAAALVAAYIKADPFEYDITRLRSEGRDAIDARDWMHTSDMTFGRGYSGRTYIAADRPAQVPLIVDALRAHDKGKKPEEQTFGSIDSILDAVPDHQDEKLVVLGQIRKLIDDPSLAALTDEERKELAELRPPDDLAKITPESLPPAVREKLTEKDRSKIGLLISIRPANRLDEWNGHDLIRFANAVRRIELADDETITTSGPSVIFADIVGSIAKDGPRVTLIAAFGLCVMVLLVVGRNRAAAAVLCATASGALLMVAACALLDLKVNFLDFVALPITLGIGVDYAINVAHRHAQEVGASDPLVTLRTSGAAVLICSLTTIIGYGSLLVSENLAIRGFGTASLVGEISCVLTALVLVPAILALQRRLPSAPQR